MTICGFPVQRIDGEYHVILGRTTIIESTMRELRVSVDTYLVRLGMRDDVNN